MHKTTWLYNTIILLTAALLTIGCSQRPQNSDITDVPDIVHTVEQHGISVTLTVSPGMMDPRQDAILTLLTRYPAGLHIDFPNVEMALEGFEVTATLSPPDATDQAGYQVSETVLRLTPIPGSHYRIAPMLFAITQNNDVEGETQYLITPAIRPPSHRLGDVDVASLTATPEPVYIQPTPAEIMKWVLVSIALLLILLGCVFLASKLKRKIEVMRMSPVERARYELEQLLAKELPAKGQFKEFYFAITGIIRTYIERQHGIRAPELTTPEFLEAAAKRPAFKPAVVERLQEFLESADLVKFAAWTPTQRAIQDTIETARNYLAEDETNFMEEKY